MILQYKKVIQMAKELIKYLNEGSSELSRHKKFSKVRAKQNKSKKTNKSSKGNSEYNRDPMPGY